MPERIVQSLRSEVASIVRFDHILAGKLFQLDAHRFAEQLGEHAYREGQPFSIDNFLHGPEADAASRIAVEAGVNRYITGTFEGVAK